MNKSYIIYKVTNMVNNKIYIGKTIYTLNKRKSEHIITTKSKCGNMVFHKAIRKYGEENFKWETIYECDDELILNIMETMKIIVNHSHMSEGGYNLTWGGEGISGYKFTDEQKKKLSESHKGITSNRKGVKLSKETKKKLSESHKGQVAWNKGKTGCFSRSIETKRKMSESHKGKKHTDKARQNMCKAQKGRIVSYETKLKIGNTLRKYNDEVVDIIYQMKNSFTFKEISNGLNIPYETVRRLYKTRKIEKQ